MMRLLAVFATACGVFAGVLPVGAASASDRVARSDPEARGSMAIHWIYQEEFRKLHFRAKRLLGDRYGCVSTRPLTTGAASSAAPVELRVTSRRAMPAARSLVRRLPSVETTTEDGRKVAYKPRIAVRLVDRRFGFIRMERIHRRLRSEKPAANALVWRAPTRDWLAGSTRRGRCEPIHIETNGRAPSGGVPPEWYSTPDYLWALRQRERYGRHRIRAYPQLVARAMPASATTGTVDQ